MIFLVNIQCICLNGYLIFIKKLSSNFDTKQQVVVDFEYVQAIAILYLVIDTTEQVVVCTTMSNDAMTCMSQWPVAQSSKFPCV